MSYKNDMNRCLAYIEEHIEEKITIPRLAELLGYSLYHFCRIFKSIQGVSAGAYIRNRQLELAAEKLLNGSSVTEAAMTYGFDTVSGFNHAFRRIYGMTPTEYKNNGGIIMNYEIKEMNALTLVAYCLEGPDSWNGHENNGAYWLGKNFSTVSTEDYQKLTYPGYAEIGIWLTPESGDPELTYNFGPVVKSTDFVPKGMKVVRIPAAEYAVFTVPAAETVDGLHDNICQAWKYIFAEWFDSSEWKYDETKMDFEYYCGEVTEIYVPVIKK